MKNKKILLMLALVVAGLFALSSNKSFARGVVVWGEAEKIRSIAELPDSEYYQTTDGAYFDLGVRYNTIHVFWIPLWIKSEPVVCGYVDKDNYVELTQEDVDAIVAENNIELKGKVKASSWDKFGGKAIVLILVLGGAYIYFKEKKEEKTEEVPS